MRLIITNGLHTFRALGVQNGEREKTMNYIKKLFLFGLISFLPIIHSFGQGQIAISGAYGFSRYDKPAESVSGPGLNLSIRNAPRKIYSFGISFGYQHLSWEDKLEESKAIVQVIPALGEFLFTPGDKTTRLIFGLSAGMYFFDEKVDFGVFSSNSLIRLGYKSKNGLFFGYTPILGVRFSLSETIKLDLTYKRHVIIRKEGDFIMNSIHAGLTFYLQEPDED